MFDFASKHNIGPIVKEFDMGVDGIEEAFDVLPKWGDAVPRGHCG
jgi:hypothetical protein